MEILQFRDSVKEILTEMTPVKELIIEKISTIIKRAVPHSEVKVYGSHATKLCLPWSDIDLVIITQNRSSDGMHMNIDITQMTDHHNGLECVGVVQDYLKENEIIEPIMFVLKQLLKASNLNNPYSGGLSSYALFLMVVSFLQSHE